MLGLAQQATGLQGVAGAVLAAQEARHGAGLEIPGAGEGRAAFLDLVAEAVGLNLRFDDVFCQSTFLNWLEPALVSGVPVPQNVDSDTKRAGCVAKSGLTYLPERDGQGGFPRSDGQNRSFRAGLGTT